MAHFVRAGQRVSGQSISISGGTALDIGLWGPMNVYAVPLRELDVAVAASAPSVRFEKRGAISNNIRIWRVSGLSVGTHELQAKTHNGEIWDKVTVRVSAPAAAGASSATGGITWERMFGSAYPPTGVVDLTARRALGPLCPAVLTLREIMQRAVVPPTTPIELYGRGAVTPHNAGAAADIYYHARSSAKPGLLAFGNGIVELLVRHRQALGWDYMSYNRMHFSQSRVTADERDVEHDNHIHIDWIDNRRTQRSTAVSSFRYKDQRGEHVKNVGAYGQPIAMFWNAGATSANFDDFRAGLDALNANIESRRTVLSAMRLADFQALY